MHYPNLPREKHLVHRLCAWPSWGPLRRAVARVLASNQYQAPWQGSRVRFRVMDWGDSGFWLASGGQRTGRATYRAYRVSPKAVALNFASQAYPDNLVTHDQGAVRGWVVEGALPVDGQGSIWVMEHATTIRGASVNNGVPTIVVPRLFADDSPEHGALAVARDAILECGLPPAEYLRGGAPEYPPWTRARKLCQEVMPAIWPVHATLCLMEWARLNSGNPAWELE